MMATPAVTSQKHVKVKVCLVGDVAVGKTSLIKRFVQDSFDDRYIATVGTKVTKKTVDVMWKGTIHNAPQFLASAKSGHGVNEAFKVLADAIARGGEA